MMCEILKNSEVTQGFPCRMIHNGVDVRLFDRRRMFSPDVTTFLFSSYGIHDERKGLCRIVEALECLGANDIQLWCLGYNFEGKALPKVSFPIKHLGNIVDPELLSMIYSSADFFINASYEEAFAQTPLESMACGTPVISTPCSGAKDLIRDFNGVVCKGFSTSDLQEGIQTALSRRYDHGEIRKYIVENFSSEKIAKRYIEVYSEIFDGLKRGR
jgi:glycosyltransferase involved in cell wall biosynthesis